MTFTPPKVPPESIIFYLDLYSKTLSKKDVSKSLEAFCEEKRKKNQNSGFTVYFFKQNTEPYISNEFTDPKEITRILDTEWKLRDETHSNFENGLFYCLSVLVSKAVKGEGTFRVVVISDNPSKKSAEYAEALMNLVETIRTFPTFIDVIRAGKQDLYPDDVKLRLITSITNGALLYATTDKEFKSALDGLAKNKQLPDLRQEGGQTIDRNRAQFFENVAKKLIPTIPEANAKCHLCSNANCNFCNDSADVVQTCPNCNETYHECCAALYSWRHNIGLKHIFRCTKCGLLLQISEQSVYAINGEMIKDDPLSQEELAEATKTEETWNPAGATPAATQSNVTTQRSATGTSDNITAAAAQAKPGAMGYGLFGPKIPKKTSAAAPAAAPALLPVEETPIGGTAKKPTTAFTRSLLARRTRIHGDNAICSVCSHVLKPTDRICPNCKSPVF